MRLGLRPQLILALAALLVVANVALFFAVASGARVALGQAREESARALGRAIAGHIISAAETRSPESVAALMGAQLGRDGAAAVAVYDQDGVRLAVRRGEAAGSIPELPTKIDVSRERVERLTTSDARALMVVVPAPNHEALGAVATILPIDASTTGAAPLVRLVALYTGVIALALLIVIYISMTRLVVRPIAALSNAAGRVSGGDRHLEVPRGGARELSELGSSLASMTDRLRADEKALHKRIEELAQAKAELERAQEELVRSERLASVGRLAAGLAHEVGNPLAAIVGFQELMLSGGLTAEEERDFLERMKKETERIQRVLRDLLDFARPARAGPRDAALRGPASLGHGASPGSVSTAVTDAIALMQPQRAFSSIDLTVSVPTDLPPVRLGTERLVQVVLNMMLNAADALGDGGGKVRISAAPADPSEKPPSALRIVVEDDGPGIPEEIADQLFEPFVTTKETGKGTGLGLAVCRGLVVDAGGTLAVAPGELGGACFTIVLPTMSPSADDAEP